MFDNRIGYVCISNNCWWVDPFLAVIHSFCSIIPQIYSSLVLYHTSMFSSDMIVDGIVVELTCSSESLVLSRDMSHGSVLFQIQILSGCASNIFLTLVVGQIWYLVNLDMLCPKNTFLVLGAGQICCLVNLNMLDPKNTFLPLEWVHTLCNCLMNLRNPTVIKSYSGDWPRVFSVLVVLSHQIKSSSIMDFFVCNEFIPLMGS